MSHRVPEIPVAELTEEQKAVNDELTETAQTYFKDQFVFNRGDGTLVGPFAVFLHTPDVARSFLKHMANLAGIPGLSKRAREVAILVVGSKYKAKYEIYSHERIAWGVGWTKEQADALKTGKKPEGMDKAEDTAFDVALQLGYQGTLEQGLWERAEKDLSREGAVALVHFIGFYSYVCILLNGLNVGLPDGEVIT